MSINNPRHLTPCVGRCSHNVGDYVCRGCGRTVEQVRDWNTYSDEKKIELMRELAAREKE